MLGGKVAIILAMVEEAGSRENASSSEMVSMEMSLPAEFLRPRICTRRAVNSIRTSRFYDRTCGRIIRRDRPTRKRARVGACVDGCCAALYIIPSAASIIHIRL